MENVPTPHNSALLGDISKTVLMPGDPLRAKFIAETYLKDTRCFNQVRNMYGYTGYYKEREVSIMGSGMGMPSMGLYSYELFHFYNVDNIIRIGSAGALQEEVNLKDIVLGMGACTDSNYAAHYNLPGTFAPIASYKLLEKAVKAAENKNIPVKIGNVMSGDMFYEDDRNVNDLWRKMGVLAAEMESAALYMNAARAGKNALGLFTISDHLFRGQHLSAEERQIGFKEMVEIALDIAVNV